MEIIELIIFYIKSKNFESSNLPHETPFQYAVIGQSQCSIWTFKGQVQLVKVDAVNGQTNPFDLSHNWLELLHASL